jgi:hypothetical protein
MHLAWLILMPQYRTAAESFPEIRQRYPFVCESLLDSFLSASTCSVGGFVVSNIAVEGCPRDLKGGTDIGDAVIFIVKQGKRLSNFLFISECRDTRMTTMSTPSTRSTQTCLRSLTNEITLKFSECAKDVKDKFAATGGGINTLGHTPKSNPQRIQLSHHINEVLKRGTEPVKLPHNEYITGTHKGECLHEAWALSFRTAHGVSKDFLAISARQSIFLQIKILDKSGNSRVAYMQTRNVGQVAPSRP